MNDLTFNVRIAVVILCFALPAIALAVAGFVWLWVNGHVLMYAGFALISVLTAIFVSRQLLKGSQDSVGAANDDIDAVSPAERILSERVAKASPELVTNWSGLIGEGMATVEDIAKSFHPEDRKALLKVTVPEALLLIEETAARLRPLIQDTNPLGKRLTIGQLEDLYRWRYAFNAANKAWDVWRIIRLLNPASAATSEIRERLTRDIVEQGKKAFFGKLARLYVREIGKSAIDLYSGRLKERSMRPAD